ncbi:MAG: type IX secretion system outer membrane channel protein PorV [Bacteroidales bacterium]
MVKKDRARAIHITGLFMVVFILGAEAFGQISTLELKGGDLNTISTAVPFITIAPDSRSGAMGDLGIASKPDLSSQHYNVAKYAFMREDGGLSISYTPWLRNLIADINLAYLATYYKPTPNQVISGSLRYFSLGEITFTNIHGGNEGQFTPFEMALDAGYSRLFTDNFSGGVVFRYIHSDLTSGQIVNGQESKPGIAVGADLGFYYQNDLRLSGNDAGYAWGINLSNLGTPVAYTTDNDRIPIPSNLGLGGRFDYGLDDYNTMSFMLDLNKLLVPTRPVRDPVTDSVIRGYPEPESIVLGMIQSIYDAPGINYPDGNHSSVFLEELAEIMLSLGVEYWYREQFAIRVGYFHEAAVKGNRKYATLGVGLKLNVFSLDFAYLVPTNGVDSPLANTVRFTLGFDFESLKL